MAEWLRRWTRNPLGSPRAGSNPADYGVTVFEYFRRSGYSTTHNNKILETRQRKRVNVQFVINFVKSSLRKGFF